MRGSTRLDNGPAGAYLARMARPLAPSPDEGGLIVMYIRLAKEDHAKLKAFERETGAPMSVQVRRIVHEALKPKRRVIK